MMTELFTAALITDGRAGLPRSSCCRCTLLLLLLLLRLLLPGPGCGGSRRGAPLEPCAACWRDGAGRGVAGKSKAVEEGKDVNIGNEERSWWSIV